MRRRQLGPARIWGAPVALAALAALTTVGLVAALLGDGLWNAVSWVALGARVAVCWWAVRSR